MCVLLFNVFNGCSLVKKQGIEMSNIYYREKLTFSKLVEKVRKFLGSIIVFSCLLFTISFLSIYIHIITFTRLNVNNLQPPGNLN